MRKHTPLIVFGTVLSIAIAIAGLKLANLYAYENFYPDSAAEQGVTIQANKDNIVICLGTSTFPITTGDLSNDTTTQFWLYEYTGDEPPFDGKFYLSPAVIASGLTIPAGGGQLDQMGGNHIYYIHTDTDLFFQCGVGLSEAPAGGGTSSSTSEQTSGGTSSGGGTGSNGSSGNMCPNLLYPTASSNPYAIGTGDFNGDGLQDVVMGNNGTSNVSVFLQNKDGTFKRTEYDAGSPGLEALAVGDLNGDGFPDIVATHAGTTVSVLLNNKDGTFGPAANYATGSQSYAVVIGDLNKDGKPDFAVTNSRDNTVSVYLNNGDGTFKSQATYPAGNWPAYIAIGDFDSDGSPDLAVADHDLFGQANQNTLAILKNNSDGTFAQPVLYPGGPHPYGIAVGDLNKDGYPDVVMTSDYNSNDVLSVYINDGQGSFKPKVDYPALGQPVSVSIGDVDGDGYPDLVVANDGRKVSVYHNNQDGTFAQQVDYNTGGYPHIATINDLNGDGMPDIAVTNMNTGSLAILFNNGDGTFGLSCNQSGASSSIQTNGGGSSSARAISSANSSAVTGQSCTTDADCLVIDCVSGGTCPHTCINGICQVGPHSSSQGSTIAQNSSSSAAICNGNGFAIGDTTAIASTDLNGDGKADLAAVSFAGSNLSILNGNGNGTFASATNMTSGNQPDAVAVGDLNGDGFLDIVVANKNDDTISVFMGKTGGYQNPVTYTTSYEPTSVAIGDLNGDTYPDIAVTNGASGQAYPPYSNGVSVFINNQDGTFAPQVLYTAGISPYSIAIADVNGDKKPDLIVSSVGNATANDSSAGTVSVLLNNGNGTFQQHVDYPVGNTPKALVVADFNGDKLPDVATANFDSDTISVLINDGNGGFKPKTDYVTGHLPTGIAVGDFNGDKSPDLAVVDVDTGVSVFLNNSNGTFQAKTDYSTYPTVNLPDAITTNDFTGDGKPDLVVGSQSNVAAILINSGNGTFTFEPLCKTLP